MVVIKLGGRKGGGVNTITPVKNTHSKKGIGATVIFDLIPYYYSHLLNRRPGPGRLFFH